MTINTLSPSGYTHLHYRAIALLGFARAEVCYRRADAAAIDGDMLAESVHRAHGDLASRNAQMDLDFAEMLLNSEA